jgi:hypothetical protein
MCWPTPSCSAVALEIMRELGLTSDDVKARVSDRRLLNGGADARWASPTRQVPARVRGGGQARAAAARGISERKLAEPPGSPRRAERVLDARVRRRRSRRCARVRQAPAVAEHVDRFGRYLRAPDALGVGEWVRPRPLDRARARLLHRHRLRAVRRAGRAPRDLRRRAVRHAAAGARRRGPAGARLRDGRRGARRAAAERGKLWPEAAQDAVVPVFGGGRRRAQAPLRDALRLVRTLRAAGFSVNHGMNAERYAELSQATRNQVEGSAQGGCERRDLLPRGRGGGGHEPSRQDDGGRDARGGRACGPFGGRAGDAGHPALAANAARPVTDDHG